MQALKPIYNIIAVQARLCAALRQPVKTGLIAIFLLSTYLCHAQAPTPTPEIKYAAPRWYFGAAAAGNINFYRGSTQKLDADNTAPTPFTSGTGLGLFVAPLAEYHFLGSRWGIMLQAGYDSRKGKYKEVLAPCNCPRDLSTVISYITIEPSVRFAPFKSAGLYLFAGPRIAFKMQNSFTYLQKPNPEDPGQVQEADVNSHLSDMNKTLISMQVGAGYDIGLSSAYRHTKFVISPFVSFHPYFGQGPRSIETWNVSTLRVGIALKIGRGKAIPIPPVIIPTVVVPPKMQINVHVPANIPVERKVSEVFPLRNYIYFNIGSTAIPARYIALTKDQAKNFKEDQLELYMPSNLPGRSPRQMAVYYNVINILGLRMSNNPDTKITLVGSSEKGPEEGKAMAETVKDYLVSVFSIQASRIKTEGRSKPKIPSEHPGGTKELELLQEGDRRVSIESSSPVLLMEFQNGPDAPLKPVTINVVEEAPVESYISFNIGEGMDSISSWSIEIMNKNGKVKNYGPYTRPQVSIPGKTILGNTLAGDYKLTITGKTKSGREIKNDTTVHVVQWQPPVNEEVKRYSIIYEFNDSKAIAIYEKYITDIVLPQIPKAGRVIIHGYTDIIGEEAYNEKLSQARALDVEDIMKRGLAKAGRTDVAFEKYGFGEDQALSPFKNEYPEERSYNRTVIIDIVPAHK